MAVNRSGRAYERYGWVILLVSATLGLLLAVVLALAPNLIFSGSGFRVGNAPLVIRLWGITWVGFSIFALVMILVPYRRGERWAWYTLWLLPLLWLGHFVLSPDLIHNLVLAVISALGLILPYRRFFSDREEQPSRVM